MLNNKIIKIDELSNINHNSDNSTIFHDETIRYTNDLRKLKIKCRRDIKPS